MSQDLSETHELTSQQKMGNAISYSARIQEAMRYDRLGSSDYHLVMTLLKAVRQGDTYDQWQEKHQRPINTLTHQSVDEKAAHADAANRYEQTVSRLKDMALWPWEDQ